MVKRILKIIFTFMVVLLIGFGALVAWSFTTREDYVYGGRFYWNDQGNIPYYQDTGLINHLAINSRDDGQNIPFDVHFRHIRDADGDSFQEELRRKHFEFDVKIVPVNDDNEARAGGLAEGTISLHVVIAAKGVLGVEPSNFAVRDAVTGETLYSVEGKSEPEMLNEASAGEAILKGYIESRGEKSDRFAGRGQELKK